MPGARKMPRPRPYGGMPSTRGGTWSAAYRQDFKPGDSQRWAAFGVQGMALYGFEAEATLFVR